MPLLLKGENLRITFGLRTLFTIDQLEIYDGDRIGLIGANGAGKSTLMSLLSGERMPDGGVIHAYGDAAMVRQFGPAEEAGEQDAALFATLKAKTSAHRGISGGEMERLRIASALSTRAPLLLADEPTTNLDFEGIEAATQALSRHEGALVLISHDRALLDGLCTIIWELEGGKLRTFPGNFSDYMAQKEREKDFAQFEYEQYRAEQARLRGAIQGVKASAGKVKKAPSRMGNSEARLHKRGKGTTVKGKLEKTANALKSRLDNLEEKERPPEETQVRMMLQTRPGIRSAIAAEGKGITLKAGHRTLLTGADFTLPTGRATVLIGPNGCGKTTLLRAIRDGAPGIRLSPGAIIGWFGQETIDTLSPEKTLLENAMADSILPQHEARTLLARMGLTAGDMQKPASVLSGGERAKAVLGRLMAGPSNLLILDEPGNHLDIQALSALEGMLSDFGGTLLLVSHDRRMIDRVAQHLLLFEEGKLTSFPGNLSAYTAHKAQKAAGPRGLEKDILRMRMAALLSRMAAPKKGDVREVLEKEYEDMAAQLRELEG